MAVHAVADNKSAGRFYAPGHAPSTVKQRLSGALRRPAAVGLFLICSLSTQLSAAQETTEQDREILRVESRFRGKYLADVRSALNRALPARVTDSDKELLMKNLPAMVHQNRIHDSNQLARLQERLATTLNLYHRNGVVELIIFSHAEPIVLSKAGAVLVFSTELLRIVGSDEAALIGVAAHELAHEYVALEFLEALRAANLSRMREIELFCDAVAAVVLIELGFDPAAYAKVLDKIATHTPAAATLNDGTNSHPAVSSRVKLITNIAALFQRRNQLRPHTFL